MSIATRIYAGGALAFGAQPALDDLKAAAYSAVIVWSVHVGTDGTLVLNNTQIVSGGVYHEADEMNLPSRLAELRAAGSQILFSVGSGGVDDFSHIATLLDGGVPGKGNPLYDNFAALKQAMVDGGGDIDAVDFDNEDYPDADVMVNFGSMLADIGYPSVTLCPYSSDPGSEWGDTYTGLLAKHGKGFVSAIHLQCYAGGAGNSPEPYGKMIADAGGDTLLVPGLATIQALPGPWWDGTNKAPGGTVVSTPDVAMYGQGDWSGMLRQGNYASADAAMQATKGGETFFFYCEGPLDLGPGKQFQSGDAVFFAGEPWWGSAPQCTGYSLSGPYTDTENDYWDMTTRKMVHVGACPADLHKRYATWKTGQHPPDGGFIWLYDSVVSCLLAGGCGGVEKDPKTTAADYRAAIVGGLS